jgi:serine/threonine protein kinase
MTIQAELEADADPQVAAARRRIGLVLQDKWRIDSLLGVGGMAAVYGATHRNGKRVAVKMLHAEFSHEDEVRGRFLQEGYAANAIQHEGAVSVLDDDVAPDGSAFIVMELLDGETVERRWESAGRHLSISEVLTIADQLLDVLVAAHERSVVHRDIKPENLFITRSGALKVLDFGIAKLFQRAPDSKTKGTQAGMVMGTPAFMAPEQALARWDEVDGRTDLWAVGATMFTLLTGLHVHEAPSPQEQVIRSATAPARQLATVAQGVPARVAEIVDRALEFERAKRWPDARTMQVAVRAELGSSPGGTVTVSTLARPSATIVRSSLASSSGLQPSAETLFDTRASAPSITSLAAERESRLTEAAKLKSVIASAQTSYAAAKKRAAEVAEEVEAARAEQTSLEHWVSRQVGTRTAAVESARASVRKQMVALGRRAMDDRTTFGGDFDVARANVTKLDRVASAAARDVVVHEAALEAYDVPALRKGVVLMGIGAVLALALLAAPIVWRATRVIEPPIPTMTTTTPALPPARPASGK